MPQLPHRINFGGDYREAIPDFTVLDIFSFYRMAVIEDKSQDSPVKDSTTEAQLIAEAIAIHQSNSNKKRDVFGEKKYYDEMPILGVRVKGTLFTFYIIPVSASIISAIMDKRATSKCTVVKKTERLDFRVPEDRNKIITILDAYHKIVTELGTTSLRRDSGSER